MIPKGRAPARGPVVEVRLVPLADGDHPGVVEVALVPVVEARAGTRRTPIDRLPTLDQVNARPHATPKHQLETRLDRAIANKAARLLDVKKLREWAFAVKARDQWKDRKTGRRVLRTSSLDPDRAEAHHIASKDDWAVRYDERNGICLSLATHDAVTTGKLRIEGTAWFTVKGARYIDGRFPVTFVRT